MHCLPWGVKKTPAAFQQIVTKKAKWHCSEECQHSFRVLQSDLLLTYYDPTKPIGIAADASN